ncbi:sensor domain-containing protein [Kitasatospora sp. NPDC054939]
MSSQYAPHSEYDTADTDGGLAAAGPARPRRTEEAPYFWRAPFASYSYRELGYLLTRLPIAIVGFSLTVTLFSFGLGTVVTVLGLPVLAALLAGARGFGRLERARARSLLALDVPAPAPVRPKRPGFWPSIGARLSDTAGWKAVLYQVVMLPWAILSFTLALVFLLVGWTMALYPAYHWVFPTYTDWPGYRVFDFWDDANAHHVYYIESPAQIAGVALVGLLLVFLTPQLVRAMASVDRAAVRGLLGR